ncbi:GNAT family N-acetyltransferase [Chloroflexota bacterium]
MEIEYTEFVDNEQVLDWVGPLWEKLNEYTITHSQYFPEYYSLGRSFDLRKKSIIEASQSGALYISFAKELMYRELVGYCVSVVSEDKQGTVESIYVESNYRQNGIGSNLMKRALSWMDNLSVKSKMLTVVVGNEEVHRFYNRYNFYPKSTKFEQVKP